MRRSLVLALLLAASKLSGQICTSTPTRLCLNSSRFQVEVSWKDFQSNTGQGQAVSLTADTGYFWFFVNTNVELVVKVLDGRTINGNFWVFFGALSNVEYTLTVTDTSNGHVRQYVNPSGNFGSVGDTSAFPPGLSVAYSRTVLSGDTPRNGGMFALPASSGKALPARREATAVSDPCPVQATSLYLNNCRFRLRVTWKDFQGNTGQGQAVPLTSDTGYFWFFNNTNVELIVKVLDATSLNGRFWIFYGALSNVQYDMVVEDTLTGSVKVYSNPLSQFASVGDTTALPPGSPGTPAVTAVGTPLGDTASANIGSAGGQVVSADGRLTVTIPADALSSTTAIGIQPITNTAPGSVWLGYRLTPTGQVFAKPVHLSFAYQDFDLAGSNEDALRWSYQDSQRSWHTFKGSTVDKTARTLSVDTTHFTDYNAGTDRFLMPRSATIPVNRAVDLGFEICDYAPDPANPGSTVLSGCRSDTQAEGFRFTNWSVNAVQGGTAATGTVATTSSNGETARYQAPGNAPTPNPVAVSVDYINTVSRLAVKMVSNIAITDCAFSAEAAADGSCPLAYSGTTRGSGSLDAGFVTYEFAASVTWNQRSIQSAGGTTFINYTPSGSLTLSHVVAGGCNISLSPSTYQIQPLDGMLTIQVNNAPATSSWGGAASTSNFNPSYVATCSDGSTSSGILPVGITYMGDALAASTPMQYLDVFSGTSHIAGETINYSFVNVFRPPPPNF